VKLNSCAAERRVGAQMSEGGVMPIAMLLEWPDMDEAKYLELIERVALGDQMFPGAIAHVAGPIEGGWRVVDVWESEEAFQRFLKEKLEKSSSEVGINPPSVSIWPVFTIRTPQGVPEPQR
jgi:hypothetical protein